MERAGSAAAQVLTLVVTWRAKNGREAVAVPSGNRRQKARLLPSLRQLLERIGNLEQCRLAPGASEEGDPNRQPPEISTCHVDIGIARNGSRARTASSGVIA